MALLSPVYCTVPEVNRLMSMQAIEDFTDHDGDEAVNDCINQATDELDFWLNERYLQSDLFNSTLVRRWCVVMACRFICQRRGNVVPESLEVEWERIQVNLQLVADGRRKLPRTQLRADLRPTWSNLRIDRRVPNHTVRKTPDSSDADTTLSEFQAFPGSVVATGSGIGFMAVEDDFEVG